MPRTGAGPVGGWGGGGGGAVLDGWEAYDATTLTPKAPYEDVRLRNLTVTGTAVITSTTTSTGQFLGANGTKTAPSYSFTGDTDTGLYLAGANNPAMSAGDTLIQGWTTSGAFVAASLAMGFTGRSQFKSSADGNLDAFAANGSTRSTVTVLRILGTSIGGTGPFIAASSAPTYGFGYNNSTGNCAVYANGTSMAEFAPNSTWHLNLTQTGGYYAINNDVALGRSAAAIWGLYGASTAVGSSLTFASDKWMQWSGTTDPDGTYDTAVIRAGAGIVAPQAASAAVGDWQAPKSSLTSATMTYTSNALSRSVIHKFTWTNAMVTALGGATAGDVKIGTLPAKSIVLNAWFVLDTQAAGTTTLTGSVGRTGATYIDWIIAKDLKAAANTFYGVVAGDRGTGLAPGTSDMPSYTATTDFYMHFISTGANLDQVTTCTGRVFVETMLLP